MGAEGVRRKGEAVQSVSAISQAKGQGFNSTEMKHHVYGILWKVDSSIGFFLFYLLIFIYLLFIFYCRPAEAAGLQV